MNCRNKSRLDRYEFTTEISLVFDSFELTVGGPSTVMNLTVGASCLSAVRN